MMRISAALVLVGVFWAPGCARNDRKDPQEPKGKAQDHSHSTGPHGGAVGHFGPGHGHFEFTVDHDLKEARIFLLMEDGERPQALPLESLILSIDDPTFTLEMKAVPGKEDRAGFSSSFVGKHYKLGIVREFSGRIEGLLEGRKISGRFKEEPPR